MNLNIDWLEPWDAICTEPISCEKELYNEVGKNHILLGKKVKAIGRRYDCDDVLFKLEGEEFKLVVVHLTYSNKIESNPNYPRTKVFKDIDDWTQRCMIPDHSEYMVGE